MPLGRAHKGRALDRLEPTGDIHGSWHSGRVALEDCNRRRTGAGCRHHEAYSRFDNDGQLWYEGAGVVLERFGSLIPGGWLYCFAPTADGAVFLGGLRLEMWQAFADMMGKWDEWDAAQLG